MSRLKESHRLLILSCSRHKRPVPDLLPAIERYDGPAFRILRRFLQNQPDDANRLDIFILSAVYGLIPSKHLIPDYDQMMTSQRATQLHNDVLTTFVDLICLGYTELCVATGKNYLRALEGWSALVPPATSVTITDGAQGLKLAQLKRWLYGEKADDIKINKRVIKTRGVACLRGVELRLTSAQVLGRARAALAEDGNGADHLRDWYVEVDGRRVAPKWLVRVLTGLPVNAFTTGEARRVLCQLGFHVHKIKEPANDHQSARTSTC